MKLDQATGKHVVAVVDDDPRVLESLENLLESAGYVARLFPSVAALLESGMADVALLITDVGMPGIDGFQLRDLMEELKPGLPVFLITGRHEMADRVRAQGIIGFFPKPFDGQTLLLAIAEALRDREGRG